MQPAKMQPATIPLSKIPLATMPLATMPLSEVPLVSLDLETTGLKPQTDRIVQIGAIGVDVAVAADRAEDDHIEMLVDPGIAVPAASTAVHGINDAMLADAKPIAVALPALRSFINKRIILGYNIGFDLAFLTNEAKRQGLEWKWSGALCLRQLATVLLGPEAMLMIADLDALAAHYGVPVIGRHTALGDATITAQVYHKMVPHLADKSIVTMADAWRVVADLDDIRQATARAGWIDVAGVHSQPGSDKAVSWIDPYPYQHRISEIMLTDPVIISGDACVGDAARLMKQGGQECVFIGSDKAHITGIVTERDIVHAMAVPIDEVTRARSIPLAEIMSAPLLTVSGSDYLHVGLGRMSRHDIRFLGVIDEYGDLAGWISARQLLRQRVTKALTIGDQLETAQNGDDLASALQGLPALATSLIAETVPGYQITAVISGQYRAALARASHLAARMMMETGKGTPPVDYVVLVLGSAGRDESLLAADQDHAIIYADSESASKKETQAWFEQLGSHISDLLDRGGIPYCKGGVMSRHARWCRSLSGWRKAVRRWVKHARPEDILNVDIFFDFVAVHGNATLARDLDQVISSRLTRDSEFLKSLARNTAGQASGRTIFGGLKTENGRFNVKANVLLPMVETIRVLAISRGITARTSTARAKALVQLDDIPNEVQQLSEDIHIGLGLVLRQQSKDMAEGLPPVNTIDLRLLTKVELNILKAIVGRVGRLQTLIQDVLF
ncbi:DUF294 nucleotidyltransferase-like domain-containing protein [Candidatus Puniceispirillum marinum]|uniref:DNA-directed DNA polymerase n=1 Tax=Puniceispirillum marinum (strain IMCC1322) TaxID=488538 RepID=D5BP79_PUNMI|nr:DUF294 nucleotidyltransferase-like domain-containing protein [Candidatus Puniceispirillum marinum]ADE38361.1 DNA polymerase III, epsilon subunit [Candidatus Puniceispirillum marinum IMCC1322]